MNTNNAPQPDPIVIQDENENKLNESSTAETSAETVSTEANTDLSPDLTPESVPTELDSTEYKDDFQSSDQSVEGNKSPVVEPVETQVVEPVEAPVVAPVETPPINVNVPVKTNTIKPLSKTQKQYDAIIKKANNLRKQFSKTRKTMPTWDDNKTHDWRTQLADTLISVIRQEKNKQTLKHHHKKLKSMSNLFNHYLNSLYSSKHSIKNKSKK
jgi:hypothetical protein